MAGRPHLGVQVTWWTSSHRHVLAHRRQAQKQVCDIEAGYTSTHNLTETCNNQITTNQ